MKKFIRHVVLFSLLPLAVCIVVLSSEPDRKQVWISAPGDCDNRGTWIYQRIFSDTAPVDIAFIGTSHTINGIQDTLIARIISEQWKRPCNVVNFGYCRFGNEMQYIIAKDLLSRKKVHTIVVEVNEDFGAASHPMFPYYASTEDLLHPASVKNQAVPANIYNGFLARLTAFRTSLYGFSDTTLQQFPEYGYRGYPGSAPPEELVEPEPFIPSNPGVLRTFSTDYSREWITQLRELCQQHGTEVRFLYIPSFHDQPLPIAGVDFFKSQARLIIVPRDSIRSKAMWRDRDHLNDAGSGVFSRFVARVLADTSNTP